MKPERGSRRPSDDWSRVAQELPLSTDEVPPDSDEPPGSMWGDIGVLTGVAAIGASLYAGHPFLGGGLFGWWRIAGIVFGLLAIAAGLVALLHHRFWHAAVKTVVVAVIVTALGAFAVYGVEQVPITVHECGAVDEPTLDNREPVYCRSADGLLTRMTVQAQDCGAAVTYETRQENGQWHWTGHASKCRL